MNDATFPIPSRHGHAPSSDDLQAPLQRRFAAVLACLNALPTDLPWKFLAELAPMLQPPTLRELAAPPAELPVLSEILAGLARGVDPANAAEFTKYLAAAMFYFLPQELPLTPAPSQLPLWIRVPYLKWTLTLPQCSQEPGEAELHAHWLEAWLKVLEVEFSGGRGLDELPEYQHARLRGLLKQHLQLLPASFQTDHSIQFLEARVSTV